MSFIFLIPLAIALGAACVFENCHDEVGTIVAVGGAVCLILSLVLLPWQFQLLLVTLILISTKGISLSREQAQKRPKT